MSDTPSLQMEDDEDSDPDAAKKAEAREAALKSAASYAWEYFKYHAQQRQAVFRFYLLLCGVTFAGLVTLINQQNSAFKGYVWILGAALVVLSILFWRLDERSRLLVKIAETYLKFDEVRLAETIGNQTIKLVEISDTTARHETSGIWRSFWLVSFKQIYRWIFALIGTLGLAIAIVSK